MQLWLKRVALAVGALAVIIVAIRYHREILTLISDQARIRSWLEELGPWGPLGLIAINVTQVVVAPIPGYFTQIAAGYLYGWPVGAIYGVMGMALGGIVAMALARVFGRPLVSRIVGEKRLAHWEKVTHLDSLPIWFFLMLGPFGDIPYFIAGLTSLPIWKIIAIAVFVRFPSVMVSAAVGAGVVSWRSPWVIGGAIILMAAAVVAMRYQTRIEQFIDQQVLSRVLKAASKEPQPETPEHSGVIEISEADATAH